MKHGYEDYGLESLGSGQSLLTPLHSQAVRWEQQLLTLVTEVS